MSKMRLAHGLLLASLCLSAPALGADASDAWVPTTRARFMALLVERPDAPSASIAWLTANWRDDYVPMALEIVRFIPQRALGQELLALVASKTGQRDIGNDWASWMRWQWSRPPPPAGFAAFKAALYANIDPRFEQYFSPAYPAKIRLDEVV